MADPRHRFRERTPTDQRKPGHGPPARLAAQRAVPPIGSARGAAGRAIPEPGIRGARFRAVSGPRRLFALRAVTALALAAGGSPALRVASKSAGADLVHLHDAGQMSGTPPGREISTSRRKHEAGSGCGHQAGRQGRSAGPIPVIEDGCAGQTPCPVRPNSSGSTSPIWQRRSARPLPSGSSQQSGGWIEIMEDAVLITPRGKTGGREVEIAPGSSGQTCPVHALGQWRHCARIDVGPLFVAVPATGQRPRANDCPPSTLPGSSGRVPARRTCGQTCRKPSGHVSSPAIPCAPDWPAVPSSTNAMSRNSLAMPRPR